MWFVGDVSFLDKACLRVGGWGLVVDLPRLSMTALAYARAVDIHHKPILIRTSKLHRRTIRS